MTDLELEMLSLLRQIRDAKGDLPDQLWKQIDSLTDRFEIDKQVSA